MQADEWNNKIITWEISGRWTNSPDWTELFLGVFHVINEVVFGAQISSLFYFGFQVIVYHT